jgi:hypothetical protein
MILSASSLQSKDCRTFTVVILLLDYLTVGPGEVPSTCGRVKLGIPL